MTPEFAYFLKVNVAFALFYAFYRLFFYKDTFFKLRRAILLAFFALALSYPLLNIQDWVKEQQPIAEVIQIYSVMMLPEATVLPGQAAVDWMKIFQTGMIGLYWLGVALLIVRFLVQLSSLLWLRHTSALMNLSGIPVYILNKPAGPFSFFRMIFVYPDNHSEKEISEILTHECTHVSEWHSLDVVLSEWVSIFCWMNPFVWLLKREVRHNLEYLADNTVIRAGYDCKSYQYHLLGLAHHHQADSQLYNSFNVLHLKNRICMMNKKRSCGIERTKYLMFVPLVLLLMLLSNMEAVARITSALTRNKEMPEPEIATLKSTVDSEIIWDTIQKKQEEKKEAKVTNPDTLVKKMSDPLSQVFTVVEEMPKFPGGDAELLKFIAQHVRYPGDAVTEGISGRVICSFIVGKDGVIRETEVLRGVDPRLDAEALRVLGLMPRWIPGKQRGLNVDVKYTIPITFSLTGAEEQKPIAPTLDEHKMPDGSDVYRVVDVMPKFPGGDTELLKFIAKNVRYPEKEIRAGTQGRVIVAFTVGADGLVSDIEILRGVSNTLDKEAVRVVRSFPAWTPGKQDGKPVAVRYTVPITFRLSEPYVREVTVH